MLNKASEKVFIFLAIFTLTNIFLNNIYYFKSNSNHLSKVKEKCDPFLKIKIEYFNINNQTYPKLLQSINNSIINFKCLNKNSKIKRILLWNKYFGQDDYGFGLGEIVPFVKNKCPVINCELTNDKNKLNTSDYVLIHMRDLIHNLPQSRPINQRWIQYLWESPTNSKFDFKKFENFFNLTMTYRLDSNFTSRYQSELDMVWSINESYISNHDYHANKTKFAAAIISNCNDKFSNRINYINELKKFIQVDVFGKCGTFKCSSEYKYGAFSLVNDDDCKKLISKEYKFYFSFENSICTDYITEKFFHILKYDIIPVVLGGGNYEYYIPRSGYINVLDYSSAQDLAKYLFYLDSNKTAYNSYFKWKKYVKFNTLNYSTNPFCELCTRLHLEEYTGIKTSIIKDISSLWYKKSNCKIIKYSN
jgi:alpha-1,3-fucosyltransferase